MRPAGPVIDDGEPSGRGGVVRSDRIGSSTGRPEDVDPNGDDFTPLGRWGLQPLTPGIVTTLSFILIFRAFDLIYVLAGPQGAPDGTTQVVGVLIYGDAFGTSGFYSDPRMSYAIAEGVTLFVFLAGVSALLIKALGRREAAIH
jgi:hypothetical protein